MKKLLLLLLIVFTYSCCNQKSVPKSDYDYPTSSIENGEKSLGTSIKKMSPPQPRPEPKPASDESKRREMSIGSPSHQQDGTAVRNVRRGRQTTATPQLTSQPLEPFEFTKGDINFVVKDTMVVGVITEVNMTISKNVDINRIISEVRTFNDRNLHTDSVRIAPVMVARLIDPSKGLNFIIAPKTSEEQFVEDGDYTKWTWDVTPLNKGNNKLSIVVDVVYDNHNKSYQVYDGVIFVYSAETTTEKIGRFIIGNWQYLLSSLLIPLLYFLYTQLKRKKSTV